jgi:hypothetical protein
MHMSGVCFIEVLVISFCAVYSWQNGYTCLVYVLLCWLYPFVVCVAGRTSTKHAPDTCIQINYQLHNDLETT